MAIRSLKTGTISRSALAGNALTQPGSFDYIDSVTVGAGGATSINFTSIPQTYKHLQIRGIVKSTTSGSSFSSVGFNVNSDTSSSYTRHIIYGNGSSAIAYGAGAGTTWYIGGNDFPTAGYTNIFGAHIVDIFNYANTNMNKTVKALTGCDVNGAGEILFSTTAFLKTTAISSIQLTPASGNFAQYTQYALYGIN